MKRILPVLLLLLSLLPLRAQDSDALKRRIVEAGKNITGITCDFVQTRQSAMLAEKAVSSGRMVYRSPEYLEWSYLKPSVRQFVFDGAAAEAGKDKMFKDMARLIVSSIAGGSLADEATFRAEVQASGGDILVTLYPLKRDMKRMFTSIQLRYKSDTLEATRFEMNEASGDVTLIEFKNSQITRR